jgi:hypothetical protein
VIPIGKIYGWFDDSSQTEATYDPPHNAPCLICGDPVRDDDVRTISMMNMPETRPERSYFYRVHRTCHEPLSDVEKTEIDAVVWDAIAHNAD